MSQVPAVTTLQVKDKPADVKLEVLETDTIDTPYKKEINKEDVDKKNKSIVEKEEKKTAKKTEGLEISGSKNPVIVDTRVEKLKTKDEEKHEDIYPLVSLYSDIIQGDKRPDGTTATGFTFLKTNYDSIEGREETDELSARVNSSIDYPKYDQVKEQVMINLTNVNEARLSDLNINERNNILGPKPNAMNLKYNDNEFERKARIQFFLPVSDRRKKTRRYAKIKRFSRDNVDTARQAEALSKQTDNLFNTTFTDKEKKALVSKILTN